MTSISRVTSLLRRTTVLPALALIALAVAGCGSSSKSTSSTTESPPAAAETTAATSTPSTTTSTSSAGSAGGAPSTIAVAADPGGQLKFDKSSIEAKAGNATINFTNDSPIAHNITIASESGQTVGESPTFTGGAKAFKVSLKPGTYKFYCSVPGHRQAGMEGTLTVK